MQIREMCENDNSINNWIEDQTVFRWDFINRLNSDDFGTFSML
jgi:hypothetical protein